MVPGIIAGRRLGIMHDRAAVRIAAMAATTLQGTTPRGRITCRRRTAEGVRERWAGRMRTAGPRRRTATEGARAWVRRVAGAATGARRAVVGLHRVVEEAGPRLAAGVEAVGLPRAAVAVAAGVHPAEAGNGVDLL